MASPSRAACWPWLAVFIALWHAAVIAADLSAADYYVRDLPGLPKEGSPVKMHAGHIEITPEHNGNLFFWHFQNKHIANKQRTVLWLNGGPGCSSEDGALMEIGPYRLKDDQTLVLNNGSWNEFANLLFVDNPVGTGFSYADTDSYVHGLDEMATQMVAFLEKFFALFPEYEHDDLYIAGESYAGQYIPYVARAILARNKKLAEENKAGEAWSLQGLLIGNGWISPTEQYEAYLTFALEKGLIEKGSEHHAQLEAAQRACKTIMVASPDRVDYAECERILSDILKYSLKGDRCYNMYDVRLRDSYPSCGMNWPADLAYVTPYLRRPEVVSALHVSAARNTGWQECNGAVGQAFKAKGARPAVDLLPELMRAVPLLLFSGAEDLICNHLGTEALISAMEWNGGKGFELAPGNWAPRRKWTFEGTDAGVWQEARNLTYVLFYNSSHMVPFDFPRRTRDMLDRFMRVDISSIGGEPTDSRIDGEKGVETTVGGASNSTQAHQQETQKQLDDAKWAAYRRSGEIVLVIVAVAAAAWAYFLWRQRRGLPGGAVYSALVGHDDGGGGAGGRGAAGSRLEAFRRKHAGNDLEASAFNESELDDLHVETPTTTGADRYAVGESDEEDDDDHDDDVERRGQANGGVDGDGIEKGTGRAQGSGSR
ncbi:Pheromone-processing carboxypeptidase KEX1 [Escovopsis weberi]|uniref:Carboxypeptidase n=1 Tax=Escovopsis weberi TaxID=150374 RepID=A0A0M9VUR7_ESCWE|nr:Pheromone-processing carboxypeptidase KEX1 [Escovopsis weberi]